MSVKGEANLNKSYDAVNQTSDSFERHPLANTDITEGESASLLTNSRSQQIRAASYIESTVDLASSVPSSMRNSARGYRELQSGNQSNLGFEMSRTSEQKTNSDRRAGETPESSRSRGSAISPMTNYIIPIVLCYIIAVVLGSAGYLILSQSLKVANRQVSSISHQMLDMRSVMALQQHENDGRLDDLYSQLLDQQLTIKHLSNLSNAHVLEVMEETKTDLYKQMSLTHTVILGDFDVVRSNVTHRIDESQAAVVDLLKLAHLNMTAKLTESKKEYDSLASSAVASVKVAQNNVTQQLQRNSEQLKAVVDITHKAVQAAQRNFTANLARSREELAAAMSDTDAAIAAAETNVTAKLAKSALEFKGAVATATHQLDTVQQNVSRSLSLMSDTLRATSADLNAQVESAKATIHEEVKAVQDSIEEYVAFTDKKFASENDFVRYQLAGTFTLLGCLISLWHLTSHLRHYYKPDVQRRVMAVLWMVPIYSITSWLSLVFPRYDAVFAALRDCYEAYAVYTFIALLIAILEDGKGLPQLLNKLAQHVVEERRAMSEAVAKRTRKPAMHLTPPFPCCYARHKPISVAATWLFQCQLMTMQFVMMKPILTALPFILRLSSTLDYDGRPPILNNTINPYSPKLYIQIAENLSVAVAFYALLSFFHGTEKDLSWCDPWPKFLCIKGVVFMTFWQGFVIQVMASLGMVNDKAALQIQNLLICIEMLIASVAHFYIFPYHEWQEGYKREKQKSTLIRDTLALQDFVRDMQVMTTPWETAPDPSASNGTIDSHAVTMCFEEAEGGKGVDVGVGDLDEGQDSGKSQAHTGRTASGDIRSERSERSERSSGDSLPEDLEGGESYFSYTSILFNQLDTQTDSRPAANMMHSLYSDSPLHAAPRPKSTGHSLSLSARPEHGYRALKGDDRDKGRDRDRDSLPIPEARRSTGGTGTGSISSSSGKGSGGDLAAALGSINRNMLQLNELGIDLGSNKSANSSNSANSFKNSNQADDEPPDASQIWLKGSGSTAVKTSLPPLWTWSAAASTAPHTESNLTGEDSGRGNSEGKAGEHEWRSVEGERGSIDGLSNSNSNSVSADDIFKPSPSTSSSPPVSSHNLDVTHGSSGFLAGASGPLNRIHSQATTALSPGTAASASSPVVHPRSFTPERNESNRGDDESDGDDCESCLHSVGTPDDSLDHHPNPDLPADLPIIPLSIPTPIPIPLSIRDTRSASLCESLSEDESPHVQPLGTDSSRSPEGVGVGSESRVDLGPAGISSRNQYDTLPLNQQSGGAAASSSHIPLKSYKALPGPFPVPAPVDRDGAVAAAMKGSVAVGSEGGERMLSRGNAPLSGLSNPHSNKDNSLVVDVIESGSKLESKRNTVAPSAAASASATPGKLVRNAQDEDDEDAEHVLPHPDSLALTHTEDFTAAHTAQGTGMEGDGTPPSLFGVEMLEEESV